MKIAETELPGVLLVEPLPVALMVKRAAVGTIAGTVASQTTVNSLTDWLVAQGPPT